MKIQRYRDTAPEFSRSSTSRRRLFRQNATRRRRKEKLGCNGQPTWRRLSCGSRESALPPSLHIFPFRFLFSTAFLPLRAATLSLSVSLSLLFPCFPLRHRSILARRLPLSSHLGLSVASAIFYTET